MDSFLHDDELNALEKVIRASEEILFAASAIARAVDESNSGELPHSDRRHIKATAARLLAEAEGLMTWATEASIDPAAN